MACQAVSFEGFKRNSCGRWEIQVDKSGKAKMLPTTSPYLKPPMPMAIAIYLIPTDSPK